MNLGRLRDSAHSVRPPPLRREPALTPSDRSPPCDPSHVPHPATPFPRAPSRSPEARRPPRLRLTLSLLSVSCDARSAPLLRRRAAGREPRADQAGGVHLPRPLPPTAGARPPSSSSVSRGPLLLCPPPDRRDATEAGGRHGGGGGRGGGGAGARVLVCGAAEGAPRRPLLRRWGPQARAPRQARAIWG